VEKVIGCVQHDCEKCKQTNGHFPLLVLYTCGAVKIITKVEDLSHDYPFVVIQTNTNERDLEVIKKAIAAYERFSQ
jgi:hypothetical protein